MMCALAVYSQERALPERRCAVPNPSATVHPTSLCLTGTNTFGELGTSNTVASSVPVAVVGGLFFTQVATGYQHSCGQMTTGAAMCWGEGWAKASCQSANARLASLPNKKYGRRTLFLHLLPCCREGNGGPAWHRVLCKLCVTCTSELTRNQLGTTQK